jgi:catechol 2,3-dioxygenase-like lactoylglutathione lyase family enzyme
VQIKFVTVYVDDQRRALAFYCDVLGFVKHTEISYGDVAWLTVVSPSDRDGVQLSLEPSSHGAVGPFKAALMADGIAFTSFAVNNVDAEYQRLMAAGVRFTQAPTDEGTVDTAVFDDTCGNLIQIAADK